MEVLIFMLLHNFRLMLYGFNLNIIMKRKTKIDVLFIRQVFLISLIQKSTHNLTIQ